MNITNTLLNHPEPAIRYKTRVGLLGEEPGDLADLRDAIRDSTLVQTLLKRRDGSGRIQPVDQPYAKWQGAHWVMATLADIGYPEGDADLLPVRDQLVELWLRESYFTEFCCESKSQAYRAPGVPLIQGRYRRCASQQANALWAVMKLGLMDDRCHAFVERLLHWQWPDGGWNCDKNPDAVHSSFMESILPMRALALYADTYHDTAAVEATERVAEIFLKRRVYLGERSGKVIHPGFTQLHYPLYWHYDLLGGLKVLAEADLIRDPRCTDALQLLAAKRLPDGGWPAEAKYYKTADDLAHGCEFVNWGGTSKRKMNPWVTVDALTVLKSASAHHTLTDNIQELCVG